MNKKEWILAVARAHPELSPTKIQDILQTGLTVVSKSLSNDESVYLTGFGIFSTVKRKSRNGRNPKTGLPLVLPEKKSVRFRPGAHTNRVVNNIPEQGKRADNRARKGQIKKP